MNPFSLVRWLDGLSVNMQHGLRRAACFPRDAKHNLELSKTHPQLAWTYPFRGRLSPSLSQFYLSTVRALQQALHPWHNPAIAVPACSFGYGLEEPATYDFLRHEILLSQAFEFWFERMKHLLPVRAAIELARRGEFERIPWGRVRDETREAVALHREYLEEVQTQGLFTHLSAAWLPFEEQLWSQIEKCQEDRVLTQELADWGEELACLEQMLRKCLRLVLLHELLHAWTRRRTFRKGIYASIGLMEGQTDGTYQHRAINEGVTEWIARLLYRNLYQEEPLFVWREVRIQNGYPFWIIEYLIQALDTSWSRLALLVPSLASHKVDCAQALFFTIYFVDVKATMWLKEILREMTGDKHAYEKISLACEHFELPIHASAQSLDSSWKTLHHLLGQGRSLQFPSFLIDLVQKEMAESHEPPNPFSRFSNNS